MLVSQLIKILSWHGNKPLTPITTVTDSANTLLMIVRPFSGKQLIKEQKFLKVLFLNLIKSSRVFCYAKISLFVLKNINYPKLIIL